MVTGFSSLSKKDCGAMATSGLAERFSCPLATDPVLADQLFSRQISELWQAFQRILIRVFCVYRPGVFSVMSIVTPLSNAVVGAVARVVL